MKKQPMAENNDFFLLVILLFAAALFFGRDGADAAIDAKAPPALK